MSQHHELYHNVSCVIYHRYLCKVRPSLRNTITSCRTSKYIVFLTEDDDATKIITNLPNLLITSLLIASFLF